jgi:type II secretory pathway component PulF
MTETPIAPEDLAQLCNSIAAEICSQGCLDINVLEIVAFEVIKQNVKALVLYLRDEVCLGNSLSVACKKHPEIFDEYFCATIGDAERRGGSDVLASTFYRLSEYLQSS